jgi:hypothetical protein
MIEALDVLREVRAHARSLGIKPGPIFHVAKQVQTFGVDPAAAIEEGQRRSDFRLVHEAVERTYAPARDDLTEWGREILWSEGASEAWPPPTPSTPSSIATGGAWRRSGTRAPARATRWCCAACPSSPWSARRPSSPPSWMTAASTSGAAPLTHGCPSVGCFPRRRSRGSARSSRPSGGSTPCVSP